LFAHEEGTQKVATAGGSGHTGCALMLPAGAPDAHAPPVAPPGCGADMKRWQQPMCSSGRRGDAARQAFKKGSEPRVQAKSRAHIQAPSGVLRVCVAHACCFSGVPLLLLQAGVLVALRPHCCAATRGARAAAPGDAAVAPGRFFARAANRVAAAEVEESKRRAGPNRHKSECALAS
jgi:hypothetical protein